MAGLTRTDEQRFATTLEALAASGLESGLLAQPALIGIGVVFAKSVAAQESELNSECA